MIAAEDLYIMDIDKLTKDLFRMGNSQGLAFTASRAEIDVTIVEQQGIKVVLAHGNGFSAFDYFTEIMKRPNKKIWKIKKGAKLPVGLALVKDRRPGHNGHYMIAPSKAMPLTKYLGALEELGLDRNRVKRVNVQQELSHVS